MKSHTASSPQIVSRAEWLAARQKHLQREKELTRLSDEIARERRGLPWEPVEKSYVFDAPGARLNLGQLFDGCSQLLVYHFMFGPGWEEGCKSCSLVADHFHNMVTHLRARDVSLVAVSLAPLAELEPFRRRMGWTFPWVSSQACDFNRDYHVSFSPEEMASGKVYYNYTMQPFPVEEAPGISVFTKDEAGAIFHTYSTYGRGVETLMTTYRALDLVPKGRAEENAEITMDWVRYRDRYEFATAAASALQPATA